MEFEVAWVMHRLPKHLDVTKILRISRISFHRRKAYRKCPKIAEDSYKNCNNFVNL